MIVGVRSATAGRKLASTGLALLALLLGACTGDITGIIPRVAVEKPAPSLPAEQMSPAVLAEHQRILAAYGGVYNDPRLQTMVEQLVERLVAASPSPDQHFDVTVLNSETVNAFALPTGQLYVTRGLIALANDESELASVIGHEMGHVIARHAFLRAEQMRDADLSNRVFTALVGDPQARALALARSKLTLASYSQMQELEADAIGIRLAAKAGFDPYGAVRFLASLQRNSELKPRRNGAAPDFLASHPATPERIAQALAEARQYRPPAADTPEQREQAKAAYLAEIDGMVFGEDPSEGFVRGRRFLHPRLGFTFTAPAGFVLDNTAKAVLGVKSGGGAALRFDVVQVPAEQTLPAYLTSGWIENIDPGSVHDVTVNGLRGATATAKSDDWDFRLFVIRFGSDVYRFIFASKDLTPETDRSFRESVGTFRRMSLAEMRQAKPLHIKIVEVKPGDTIEKLAGRMAIPDRQVERFRVLNGLNPGDKVTPGTEVKTIAD